MATSAKILADSIGHHGVRITTLEVTFPRPFLAELNTHCALSRNSASSRAIPPERIIEQVERHPYVPKMNKRVKGMGVGEPLSGRDEIEAENAWLQARDDAVLAARKLLTIDVDKSRVNRLLEPFMWHTAIITATDWANFFAQRDHPAAQPEVQTLAAAMRVAMEMSVPEPLERGQWHLPMVSMDEYTPDADRYWALVSAGRVARVSFDNHWREEDPDVSHERAMRLVTSNPGHWSPTEHPAQCLALDYLRSHKYRGWRPLRKLYPSENIKD